MTDLKGATLEELQAELARRNKPPAKRPKLREAPDFRPLAEMMENEIARIEAGEYPDDDLRAYVWESAMTALYGDAFWPWWSRVQP